ncbi:MAG: SPOR domain-containing protein, partial [Marinosulfonomonas sp.]|nr:SPOR domain-containing protein [Marinosulfonomonas sp.]
VSGTIEQTTLDPIASAAAAIEAADGKTTDGDDATPAPAPVVEPAGTPKPLFALAKSYVQLATFSDEAGATEAADTLRAAGMEPVVKEQGDASGWRVLVGPAANRKQRTALAKQLKGLGFTDAHFVKE